MLGNKWLIFVVALVLWGGVFYAMDKAVMESQGLPVGTDLMPL